MSALRHRLGSRRPLSARDGARREVYGNVFVWFSSSSEIQRVEPPDMSEAEFYCSFIWMSRRQTGSGSLKGSLESRLWSNCARSAKLFFWCSSMYLKLYRLVFLQHVWPGFCSMLRKFKSTLKKRIILKYHPKSIFKSPHLQRIPSFLFVVKCILVL